jgi:peptidase E
VPCHLVYSALRWCGSSGGEDFSAFAVSRWAGLVRQAFAVGSYLGASADSNVACPSIRTTNDMSIVEIPVRPGRSGSGVCRFDVGIRR